MATTVSPQIERQRPSLSRTLRRARQRWLAPYLFVLPFLISFAMFGVYPLIFTLQLSFTNWRGSGVAQWIGWDNYSYLLSSSGFWSSILNSAVFWLLIVPVQVLIAVLAGVALNNARLRLRGFYRVSFIVPFITPLIAMAQIWIVLFDTDYGAINTVLGGLGLPGVEWLTSTIWAKPTIALLFLWKTTGFAILVILSGLQSIPGEIYEAASIDGASRARQLMSITMPLIRRSMAFLVVMQTLAVFQMFSEPFVMTEGGPYGSTTTAGLYLYRYIRINDLGTGAANSFLLVGIIMLLSLLSIRLLRPKD